MRTEIWKKSYPDLALPRGHLPMHQYRIACWLLENIGWQCTMDIFRACNPSRKMSARNNTWTVLVLMESKGYVLSKFRAGSCPGEQERLWKINPKYEFKVWAFIHAIEGLMILREAKRLDRNVKHPIVAGVDRLSLGATDDHTSA